jgi:hypothetical protein
MSDFSDEAWFDFVRHLLPETETAQMTRHLDDGCEECQQRHAFWQKLGAITSREWLYEPDDADLRIAKAAYAAGLARLYLPKNAHLAALVFDSFRDPAPAGFRATAIQTRHLICRAKGWTVALRLTQEYGHGVFIGGQVTQSMTESLTRNEKSGPFEVTVLQADKFVERMQTNAVGEFYVRCLKQTHVRLYVDIPEEEALEIRLPSP